VANRMDPRGKMIVLEGVDRVGKSTAAQLVAARLRERGLDVAEHRSPAYDEPRFGPLTAGVLDGSIAVSGERAPWVVATLFAANRAATADALTAERSEGRTLVCDRYHLANAAYHGAQVPPERREEFVEWVLDVELRIFGVPRPDLCLWLKLPLELRPQRERNDDLYERDLDLQRRVHDVYERLARLGHLVTVDIAPDGVLLSREAVADAILAAIDAR
jgi:dTMP kinase